MSDCIFCKIIAGTLPTSKVFENDKVLAFKDLRPQAARHLLFIHKKHTRDVNEMSQSPEQISDVFMAIKEFSVSEKLDQKGFRIVTNLGEHAGQTVFHTHFHVLGGEPLGHFGS
jgi:histidine triad (HIT) family protein